jgi:hypothetical protein
MTKSQEELNPEIYEYLSQPQCTPKKVDFTNTPDIFLHRDVTRKNYDAPKPRTASGRLATPDRVKGRMKSLIKRVEKEEYDVLYRPVEEWDMEELARGRPKNAVGSFAGRAPAFVTRAVHEAAMARFQELVRSDMNNTTIKALSTLDLLLSSQEVDDNGKPIVPASTKADISKFLLEHIVGKPMQRIQNDISVKLQGILGAVMVTPDMQNQGQSKLAHYPGVTMPMAERVDDDDDMYIDAE